MTGICTGRLPGRTAFAAAAAVVILAAAPPADAGALVTRAGNARLGDIAVSGSTVRLAVAAGAATFQAADLAWFATDGSIRTFLAAAMLAFCQGAPDDVVAALLDASIEKEPATADAARGMLARVKPVAVEKTATSTIPVIGVITDVGPQVYQGRYANLSVSFDTTDFHGFVDWSPPQYPRTILVPDFSSTSVRTTVLVPLE
jgi:hypothetical protein